MRNDKAYNMIESLPIFWLVYVTVMYALSFNLVYDNWIHDVFKANFDASTIVIVVFWILCIKEKWGYWASASLVFLTIISVADNLYVISKSLSLYDSYFLFAAYTLALLYWRNEMEITHGKLST